LSLINKIHDTSKHVEVVSIELYTLSLPVSMGIFVKRAKNGTLEDTFEEAIKVEKYMLSLKGNSRLNSDQSTSSNSKKKILPTQDPTDKKDQDSMDMESLQRIVKKLTNEIVDMKKIIRENIPTRVFFKTPFRKTIPPTNKNPSPIEGINMEDIVNVIKPLTYGESSLGGQDEEEGEDETNEEDQSGNDKEDSKLEAYSLWDISHNLFRGDEDDDDVGEMNLYHNAYNTRSKFFPAIVDSPSTYENGKKSSTT
jgi:hypothetical protein